MFNWFKKQKVVEDKDFYNVLNVSENFAVFSVPVRRGDALLAQMEHLLKHGYEPMYAEKPCCDTRAIVCKKTKRMK